MQSILGVLLLCVTVTVQGQTGAIVVDSSNVGVNIQKTSGNGISILNAGSNGVNVTGSTNDGYSILLGGNNGFFAGITGADGLHVSSAGVYGVQIEDSGNDAIRIDDAGDDGLDVHGATGDGVYVTGVGRDGIFVNSDVGRYSMQIWGNKNLSETPIGHIAHLENRNLNSNADVLSLKVGRRTASAWPGSGNNFITFFNGDSVALGRVEGNGSGGVVYGTSGSDYAESLPQINASEKFFPGEIVGVHDGRISHVTKGAAQVMVVTDQPAVLGNSYDQQEGYKPVSFIGQIPVKVKGTVKAGDWIVPDGNHQGIAVAVNTAALTPSHQIVGRAWESSSDTGVKRVNTAVGLDQSEALLHMIQVQQQQIEDLRSMILEMKKHQVPQAMSSSQ